MSRFVIGLAFLVCRLRFSLLLLGQRVRHGAFAKFPIGGVQNHVLEGRFFWAFFRFGRVGDTSRFVMGRAGSKQRVGVYPYTEAVANRDRAQTVGNDKKRRAAEISTNYSATTGCVARALELASTGSKKAKRRAGA